MTQTEREIQRLKETIAAHIEIIEGIKQNTDDLWKENEKLEAIIDKNRDAAAETKIANAVQTARFDEFQRRWDESDRRRWTVYGVMLAAALTFVANLVLLVLRK